MKIKILGKRVWWLMGVVISCLFLLFWGKFDVDSILFYFFVCLEFSRFTFFWKLFTCLVYLSSFWFIPLLGSMLFENYSNLEKDGWRNRIHLFIDCGGYYRLHIDWLRKTKRDSALSATLQCSITGIWAWIFVESTKLLLFRDLVTIAAAC